MENGCKGLRRNKCRALIVGPTLRGGPCRVTECRGYINATVITSWILSSEVTEHARPDRRIRG
jgi:hypothetical protein